MPRGALGLWLTTAIWVAVAGGLWAYHDYQLKNGEEIELKTVPVDPRDPLRGDYVILRYGISSIRRGSTDALGCSRPGQPVFVALERAGEEWAAADVACEPPAAGRFLRGRVRSSAANRLDVAYGIESFFVPEGEGKKYESARNRGRLWAVASVSPHGVAHLKRLEIR